MSYRFLSHNLVFQTRSFYRLLNVPALARLANKRCAASCLWLNFRFFLRMDFNDSPNPRSLYAKDFRFVLRLGSAFCFIVLNRGNFDLTTSYAIRASLSFGKILTPNYFHNHIPLLFVLFFVIVVILI